MFVIFTFSSSGEVGSRDGKKGTAVLTHKRNRTTLAEGEARQKQGSQGKKRKATAHESEP